MLMRRVVAGLLLAAAATSQADERKELARELRADPFATLAAIGSSERGVALEQGHALAAKVDSRTRLRLLRVGLAADEERVVFGALMLLAGEQLPLAELRNAAARAIPRVGDGDCPLTLDEVRVAWGSVDVPAVVARVPALRVEDAAYCLGDLHRMVRQEHVPALCELALATKGEVRRGALDDATLTSRYSGEHGPLVVTTWAKCSDVKLDDAANPDRLPAALRASLQWLLDNPEPSTKEAREVDRTLRPHETLLRRWLMASRAGVKDLPLLRALIEARRFTCEALAALGRLDDAESLSLLREAAASDRPPSERAARLALSQRGDAAAYDELLAGPDDWFACRLAAASTERRRAFAAHVLALPRNDAMTALSRIHGALTTSFEASIPPVDEAGLAAFEPLAAEAKDLDVRVLSVLVAVIPSCASLRLADRLLAHPVDELFVRAGEWPWLPRGDLGFRGLWPFLEVTRPDLFRARLREGLASGDGDVRATCAELLLQLGDKQSAAALLAWIRETVEDGHHHRWPELAVCGGDEVRNVLLESAATAKDEYARVGVLKALARLHGMPAPAAESWRIPAHELDLVAARLRDRDAAGAFLAHRADLVPGRPDGEQLARLLPWRDDRIEVFVRQTSELPAADVGDEARWQLDVGLHRKDPAVHRTLRELAVDGRYATHAFHARHMGAPPDLSMLAFWIDELGANCCRRVVADEALRQMFGEEPEHGTDDNESVTHRLRRRLLPLQERLRWSKLANGYVVAGS